MSRVICAPVNLLPSVTLPGVDYFSMYSTHAGVGHIAPTLRSEIRKKGLVPSVRTWDFVSIALSVAAADLSCKRSNSVDGWTRIIELDVSLCEPDPWIAQRSSVESTLRFLTGDFWKINFLPGGEQPPHAAVATSYDADCVSLLSGGLDSLVGAIDLTAAGRKPLFVSQIVRGDKEIQGKYADALGATNRYFHWSHPISFFNRVEPSTRGRSIIFFAYAALAASAINSRSERPTEIVVPENGFISLNVPLNAGRMGSFSTKTTHPVYLNGIQEIWNAVGIHAKLSFPYRFKTKGELLIECADQTKLTSLVGESTSCGKFGRYGLTHCGRCVPCIVRRAAFLKAGLADPTIKNYRFPRLSGAGRESGANDIGAVAVAYLQYKAKGVRRFVGGSLAFATASERSQYEGVVSRGMDELGQFLTSQGVI